MPALTPVITPLVAVANDAIAELLLLQVPLIVVLANAVLLPAQTEVAPVIVAGTPITVTVSDALAHGVV